MALLISLCANASNASNDGCKALCIRDDYDGGYAIKGGCICQSVKRNYDDFLKGVITLGNSNDQVRVLVPEQRKKEEVATETSTEDSWDGWFKENASSESDE